LKCLTIFKIFTIEGSPGGRGTSSRTTTKEEFLHFSGLTWQFFCRAEIATDQSSLLSDLKSTAKGKNLLLLF
jgi:hypothetical protein